MKAPNRILRQNAPHRGSFRALSTTSVPRAQATVARRHLRGAMDMATQIRHILVAIGDVQGAPRGELRKAGIIARAAHATVELFHSIDEPDPERGFPQTATRKEVDQHRAAIAEKYRHRLERLTRGSSLRGVTVRCTAAWDYPPHAAIIR